MTLGDVIVLVIIGLLVGLILFFQMRNKKKGKKTCNCSHCDKKEFCQNYKVK